MTCCLPSLPIFHTTSNTIFKKHVVHKYACQGSVELVHSWFLDARRILSPDKVVVVEICNSFADGQEKIDDPVSPSVCCPCLLQGWYTVKIIVVVVNLVSVPKNIGETCCVLEFASDCFAVSVNVKSTR